MNRDNTCLLWIHISSLDIFLRNKIFSKRLWSLDIFSLQPKRILKQKRTSLPLAERTHFIVFKLPSDQIITILTIFWSCEGNFFAVFLFRSILKRSCDGRLPFLWKQLPIYQLQLMFLGLMEIKPKTSSDFCFTSPCSIN